MKHQLKLVMATAVTIVVSTVSVSAECYCACIDNKKTKVCENSWDANYVYCGGTYCSGYKDETKSPYQESIEYIEAKLLAPLEIENEKES